MLEKERDLCQKINSSACVQQYLDAICSSLLDCIYFMALERTISKNEDQGGSKHFFIPEPYYFNRELQNILFCKEQPSEKDTGSVMNSDVMEVLVHGNIRERCYQLLNLFCRGSKNGVVRWLVLNSEKIIPKSVNRSALEQICVKMEIASGMQRQSDDFKRFLKQPFVEIKRVFFVCSNARERVRRKIKSSDEIDLRLSASDVEPPLSHRESKVVHEYMMKNKEKLPWVTGRLQWKIKSTSLLHKKFNVSKKNIISGLSGHTESLLFYLPLFKCFDLEITTLICILWLVPCEHHSMWEVLFTARAYGLGFNPNDDPVDFCEKMLQNVHFA